MIVMFTVSIMSYFESPVIYTEAFNMKLNLLFILYKMTWLMMFMRIGGRKVIVNTLNMSLVRATVTLHTEMS